MHFGYRGKHVYNQIKTIPRRLAFAVVLSFGLVNNTNAQDGAFAIEEITVMKEGRINI